MRAFADTMGVSKSTVVEAYERLAAEGAVVARPGSGFYVAGKTRPLSLQAMGPRLDRIVDPLWITRQAQQAGSDQLKPGARLAARRLDAPRGDPPGPAPGGPGRPAPR